MSDADFKADRGIKTKLEKSPVKGEHCKLKFIRSSITGGGVSYLTQKQKCTSLDLFDSLQLTVG